MKRWLELISYTKEYWRCSCSEIWHRICSRHIFQDIERNYGRTVHNKVHTYSVHSTTLNCSAKFHPLFTEHQHSEISIGYRYDSSLPLNWRLSCIANLMKLFTIFCCLSKCSFQLVCSFFQLMIIFPLPDMFVTSLLNFPGTNKIFNSFSIKKTIQVINPLYHRHHDHH